MRGIIHPKDKLKWRRVYVAQSHTWKAHRLRSKTRQEEEEKEQRDTGRRRKGVPLHGLELGGGQFVIGWSRVAFMYLRRGLRAPCRQ